MSEVKVLVSGYAFPTGSDTYKASPSAVIIKDSGKIVLVDPGANSELLSSALQKEGILPSEVGLIFLTHTHADHFLNIRLFPQADICDGTTLFRDDEEIAVSETIPGTTIKIIPTPGHSDSHYSLLAETAEGVTCIAGDLFWWSDGDEQRTDEKSLLKLKDPFAVSKTKLIASRKKILNAADLIIPGHGQPFSNPQKS